MRTAFVLTVVAALCALSALGAAADDPGIAIGLIPPGLTDAQIDRVRDAHAPELFECWDLLDPTEPARMVSVSIDITVAGHVLDARPFGMPRSAVANCLRDHILRWQFPTARTMTRTMLRVLAPGVPPRR